jgi:MFS family permease
MLGSANALIGFARWGGMIVGPAIAGGLYSVGGAQTVFAIDSVSFLASAGLVALARPRPAERAAQLGAFREIADGFRYVAGIPWLWVTISMASVSVMIAVAPFQALLPKLISTHFHQGVGALGTMTACFGLGTAAGALLFGQRGMRGRRVVVAYSCWGLANLVCAVSVLLPWFGAAAALAVGRGLLVGFALGIWETTLMELVPTDRLARVISLDYFGSLGLLPVGLIVAGLVSPLAPPGTLIAIGQSASGALLLLALLSRRMREI